MPMPMLVGIWASTMLGRIAEISGAVWTRSDGDGPPADSQNAGYGNSGTDRTGCVGQRKSFASSSKGSITI